MPYSEDRPDGQTPEGRPAVRNLSGLPPAAPAARSCQSQVKQYRYGMNATRVPMSLSGHSKRGQRLWA